MDAGDATRLGAGMTLEDLLLVHSGALRRVEDVPKEILGPACIEPQPHALPRETVVEAIDEVPWRTKASPTTGLGRSRTALLVRGRDEPDLRFLSGQCREAEGRRV